MIFAEVKRIEKSIRKIIKISAIFIPKLNKLHKKRAEYSQFTYQTPHRSFVTK